MAKHSVALALLSCPLLLHHVREVRFVDPDPVQVELLLPEETLALIVLVLQKFHRLPQVAVDILDLALAVSVINRHFNHDLLVWVIEYLVYFSEQVDIILGTKAVETTFALDVALEVEALRSQPLDRLLLYLLFLAHREVARVLILPLLHVRYPLGLQEQTLHPSLPPVAHATAELDSFEFLRR